VVETHEYDYDPALDLDHETSYQSYPMEVEYLYNR
jgi:hypothetical protein